MILPINTQIYYFLFTTVAGAIIGIMFDIYRIIRGFNNPNKLITAFSDLLFWILSSIVLIIFFFITNNGELRYYTFVGIIIGLFLYFELISKFILETLRVIVYYAMKFFRTIMILIFYPIRLFSYGFKVVIYKINIGITKFFNNKRKIGKEN